MSRMCFNKFCSEFEPKWNENKNAEVSFCQKVNSCEYCIPIPAKDYEDYISQLKKRVAEAVQTAIEITPEFIYYDRQLFVRKNIYYVSDLKHSYFGNKYSFIVNDVEVSREYREGSDTTEDFAKKYICRIRDCFITLIKEYMEIKHDKG